MSIMDNNDLQLLEIRIERIKAEIGDTSIGLSLLGIFFLALIPLFYSIIGIYGFTLKDIEVPLAISVTIVLMATIFTIVHWDNNKKKLEKVYAEKEEMIKNIQLQQQVLAVAQSALKKKK